jgi:hypothetical protein
VLPLLQVRSQLGMSPFTRPTASVALAALTCFGLVDLVVASTALPLSIDFVVLAAGSTVYGAFLWSRRTALGLGAFRSTLQRVPRGRRHPAGAR